jgi:Ca2+-binding EF-hand superfamily protein
MTTVAAPTSAVSSTAAPTPAASVKFAPGTPAGGSTPGGSTPAGAVPPLPGKPKSVLAALKPKEEENKEEKKEEVTVTEFARPQWLATLMALLGLDTLELQIAKEREKRADDFFQHPYPEIHAVVTSTNFEVFMGIGILTNCIFLGLEASDREGENEGFFDTFEHIFVVSFVTEWQLRLLAFGWTWLFEWPNVADTFLVWVPGVLMKWVLIPLGTDISFLRIFTVLRALRLVRLARAVRLFPAFKEMWLLVRGLLMSMMTLFWMMIIVICLIYVFAIIATEVIGKSASFQDDPWAMELFGDLLKSMFTLFQLMTLDTWADLIARPIMKESPELGLFFVFFVTVAVFVVMNLITAVIVENAFAIAKDDQEQAAKMNERNKIRELKSLSELFQEIDIDGSGKLTKKEFVTALGNPRVTHKLLLLEMTKEDLTEAWELLDDGDGELDITEFASGLRRMKGEAKSKDVLDTVRRTQTSFETMATLQKQIKELEITMGDIQSDAGDVSKDVRLAHGILAEIAARLVAAVNEEDPDQDHGSEEEKDDTFSGDESP